MSSLAEIGSVVQILPENLRSDDNVAAAAGAIEEHLVAIAADISNALPLLPNLDKLPERIIDILAWQFHVDFYDASTPIAERRSRVQQAIEDHRIAGTRAGMKRALEAVFGSNDFDIVEWWQADPPGDPFTFWVFVHVGFTEEQFETAQKIARVLGNVRSEWVGYITWAQLEALPAGYTWDTLEALGLEWQQLTYYYIYGPA